jgi:hypothetical protein
LLSVDRGKDFFSWVWFELGIIEHQNTGFFLDFQISGGMISDPPTILID